MDVLYIISFLLFLNFSCVENAIFGSVVKCPSNCRCVSSKDEKAKYNRVYNKWFAQKMYRYTVEPSWHFNQGREMTCLGLLSVPQFLPTDLVKLHIYGGRKGLQNTKEENVYSDEPVTERKGSPFYQITALSRDTFKTAPGLVDLVITGNRIYQLTDELSPLRRLENLSLRKNQIRNVSPTSLQGLDNLRTIDLSNNYIGKLPIGFFMDTVSLDSVKLAENQIGLQGIHRDTFITLFQMRLLDLSDNKLSAIHPDIFRGNRQLQDLNLAKNKLRNLEKGWFWNIPNLRKLNLEGNLLLSVRGIVFKPLRLLKELNLAGNHLAYVHRNIFLPLPKLEKLDISNNNIHHLGSYTFADLSSLKELKLQKNSLKKISGATFVGLGSLQKLSLSKNNLKSIANEVYAPLKTVRHLDLSRNEIKSLKPKAFFGMHNIRELILDHNDIHNIDNEAFTVSWVRHYSRIVWLSLQNNKIQYVDPNVFRTAPHIKHLDLGHNIIYQLDDNLFSYISELTTLKIEDNQLSELSDDIFKDLEKLQLLNLAGNKLLYLPAYVFNYLGNVQEINLADNRIMSIPDHVFKNVSNLVHVDISGNNLKKLRMKLFEENRRLRRVSAANSSLSEVEVDVPKYKLDFLDLADNKIKRLDNKLVSWLAPNSTLQLGRNPLTCDCTVGWIADAIHTRFLNIPDHSEITCKTPIWTAGKQLSDVAKSELVCIRPQTPIPQPRQELVATTRGYSGPIYNEYCKNRPKRLRRSILEEWHATVFDARRKSICSGVRLSDDYILTHASCWRFHNITEPEIQSGRILVKTGSERHRRSSFSFRVKKVIYHPDMAVNSRSEYRAIALVKIEAIRSNSNSDLYPCIAGPINELPSTPRRSRAPHYFLTAKSETVRPHTRIKLRTITTRGVKMGACDGLRYACTKSLLRAMPPWKYLTESSPLYRTKDLSLIGVRSMKQTTQLQTYIGLYDVIPWIYSIVK